jgi:hypothetical protein
MGSTEAATRLVQIDGKNALLVERLRVPLAVWPPL